jgi:hypothetical protein
MNVITEMERRKSQLRIDMKAEDDRHTATAQALKDEYRLANERINLVSTGLDEEKLLLAEHVLEVDGLYSKAGDERVTALEKAKTQILAGGGRLQHEYQGTKSYDRWHGQWIECSYGMGPRHGGVIFRIGLAQPVRKREQQPLLTDDEIEACLYYLNNLERIQEAREKAKVAA